MENGTDTNIKFTTPEDGSAYRRGADYWIGTWLADDASSDHECIYVTPVTKTEVLSAADAAGGPGVDWAADVLRARSDIGFTTVVKYVVTLDIPKQQNCPVKITFRDLSGLQLAVGAYADNLMVHRDTDGKISIRYDLYSTAFSPPRMPAACAPSTMYAGVGGGGGGGGSGNRERALATSTGQPGFLWRLTTESGAARSVRRAVRGLGNRAKSLFQDLISQKEYEEWRAAFLGLEEGDNTGAATTNRRRQSNVKRGASGTMKNRDMLPESESDSESDGDTEMPLESNGPPRKRARHV